MKRVFLLMSFCFFSSQVIAKDNCVIVIFGGSKEWGTLAPGIPTDISISVDSEVSSQVRRTGCRTLHLANDSEKEFYQKLKALSAPPYNLPQTTYHLAFTDHGMPPGQNINESKLITGKGEATTYGKFMSALKENLPKGAHVTFQTNNCWPNLSHALIANNMESHLDICGASSTSSAQMSWNLSELDDDDNGKLTGPYGAVGLYHANSFRKKYSRFPSMYSFHHNAKKGDIGNIKRQPGLLSSVTFAELKLQASGRSSPMILEDLSTILTSVKWKYDQSLENFLKQSATNTEKQIEASLAGSCQLPKTKSPFNMFVNNVSSLYQKLLHNNNEILPEPHKSQNKLSKKWFEINRKNLAKLLSTVARERAEFVKKNAAYARSKYPEIEKQWKAMEKRHNESLNDFSYNLRILQEGQILQQFLLTASTQDKARFFKYLRCETKPML